MKPSATDTPELDDSSAREKTGKSLAEWFATIEREGIAAKGRRELVQHLHSACKLDEWWATTLAVEFERHSGAKEKDGRPKGYSICATKTIQAPLARVFAAFGSARELDHWLGPGTRVAFEDGGKLENEDGDRATFRRIRADKDLRLDWQHVQRAPDSQVEVLFAAKGAGKTGITLNHTRIQARHDADELRAGWGAALERLKQTLEAS